MNNSESWVGHPAVFDLSQPSAVEAVKARAIVKWSSSAAMSVDLTQSEANELMAMPKRPCSDDIQMFPSLGGKLIIELESVDKSEDFMLDVTRSRIDFSRITYQNRGRVVVVLKRLDLNGPPHRNPDDQIIPCPHLHTYREGYGDKWAQPLPTGKFTNLDDMSLTLSQFMTECNVIELPPIQTGLF